MRRANVLSSTQLQHKLYPVKRTLVNRVLLGKVYRQAPPCSTDDDNMRVPTRLQIRTMALNTDLGGGSPR